MAKPKFDPGMIQKHQTVGGLMPTDFMRPLTQESGAPPSIPALPQAVPKPTVQKVAATQQKEAKKPKDLPMPTSRKTEARVTVIFRASPDLDQRLKRFCQEHDASIQDTATLALEEFLERRDA